MIGNVPLEVSAILAYTPEQRDSWIASCEETLADYDQNALADLGIDVDELIQYNRAVLEGVRARLAKGSPAMSTVQITLTAPADTARPHTWQDVLDALAECTPMNRDLPVSDGLSDAIDTHRYGFRVQIDVVPS